MAKQVKLTAERRTATRPFRSPETESAGLVPAVIYGGEGQTRSRSRCPRRDINAMLSHASGENILVELEIDGRRRTAWRWSRKCSTHRIGGAVLHIDFHAVSMDEMIEADVPLGAHWALRTG